MGNKKSLLPERSRKAIYIRFTDREYSKLESLCREQEEKMQTIIKSIVFNGKDKRPLMTKEDHNKIVTELKRIGNNINQIARHFNSGWKVGWYNSLKRCTDEIIEIREFLVNHVDS